MYDETSPQRTHTGIWIGVGVLIIIIIGAVIYFTRAGDSKTPGVAVAPPASQVVNEVVPPVTPPVIVYAGTGSINLRASNASAQVGQEVTVDVTVDTEGRNINLVQAVLEFDAAVISARVIDAADSDFSLQLNHRIEDNRVIIMRGEPSDGDARDSDDGYTGSNGHVARVIFTTHAAGDASVSLNQSESNMYVDDGLGSPLEISSQNISIAIQ